MPACFAPLIHQQGEQHRQHESLAKTALQNILHEVQSNEKLLAVIHENNVTAVNAQSEGQGGGENQDSKFIPGLQLQETAWETLLSTGVSNHVDYATVLKLSETYLLQSVYKQTGTQLPRRP